MVFEERHGLRVTVDAACMDEIGRLRALLSNGRRKKPGLEGMLTVLLDGYLDRHSPERRIQRREYSG